MTFVSVDARDREGYLECDIRACSHSSPVFVMKMGGDLPEGWVESQRFRAGQGTMGHLCPEHAGIERNAQAPQ